MRLLLVLCVACASKTPQPNEMNEEDPMHLGPSGPSNSEGNGNNNPNNMMNNGGGNNTPNFQLGGTVTHLTAIGLVLKNKNNDTVAIMGNGPFHFTTRLGDREEYDVTIQSQPPGQLCTVSGGAGTINMADVSGIAVDCVLAYGIGGTISGVPVGGSVTLTNNDGNETTFTQNGDFVFSVSVLPGGAYSVEYVRATGGVECGVLNPAGTVNNAAITNVQVICLGEMKAVPGSTGAWGQYYKPLSGPCTGDEVGHYSRCQHLGEIRIVSIPGLSDCLTQGADSLRAFEWVCDIGSGHAVYSSYQLKKGKHLSDLIDFGTQQYRDVYFFVQKSPTEQLRTPASKWVPNTLVFNSTSLGAPGTVYAFTTDVGAALNVTQDHTSVVVQPGLGFNHAISGGGVRFAWIEGAFSTVTFSGSKRSVFDNIVSGGVDVGGGRGGLLRDVSVANGDIDLISTNAMTVRRAYVNTATVGFNLTNANNTVVQDAHADTSTNGYNVTSSKGVVLQNVTSFGASDSGIRANGTQYLTVLGAALLGNAIGVDIFGSVTGQHWFNVAAVGNSTDGLVPGGAAFFNYAALGNTSLDVNGAVDAGSGGRVLAQNCGGSCATLPGTTGPIGAPPYFSADGRALTADTTLRGQALTPANGFASFDHYWASGASGPAQCFREFDNGVVGVTGSYCKNTALMSATERPDSDFNDNDALCEQYERCLVLSNIGAYAGSGGLSVYPFGYTGPVQPVDIARYSTTGVVP